MATTVIGAGYAGVMAANRLAASGESVTLVTPHPWFVERIRLHALASGARHTARVDLRELLHPEVDLVLGTVHRIEDGRLALGSGGEIGYETLLYAVGSGWCAGFGRCAHREQRGGSHGAAGGIDRLAGGAGHRGGRRSHRSRAGWGAA